MKQTHKDKSLVKKVALSVFAVGVATSFVLVRFLPIMVQM